MQSERGVHVTRVELSIGSLDLFRFDDYDHAFPRHSHDRFTIGAFGRGNGRIRMSGQNWTAADGAILAIPPDAAHSAEPLKGRGWTYRSLYPSFEVMDAALESSSADARFGQPVIADASLAAAIVSVHVDLERSGSTLKNEERLLSLLRSIVDRHAARSASARAPASSGPVLSARRYIDENYARAVRLAELSSMCGLSPFHLIRSFSDSVGMTPHSYLMQVRATRARDLLLAGIPISTSAFECGFSDQSHLTRTFKRIFGVTPGVYVNGASRAD